MMNKLAVIKKGDQQTFEAHPEVVTKTMNKEEKNSHVLPFRRWVVYFSPFLRCTPQGMHEKNGKYRVILDSSTQTWMEASKLPSGNHIRGTRRHHCMLPFSTGMLCYHRCFWFYGARWVLHINKPRLWFKHLSKLLGAAPSCNQKLDTNLLRKGRPDNQAQDTSACLNGMTKLD